LFAPYFGTLKIASRLAPILEGRADQSTLRPSALTLSSKIHRRRTVIRLIVAAIALIARSLLPPDYQEGQTMLTKKDAVIGQRVQWRPSDTTKHLCLGTIRDIKPDGEVIIEYDDGAISSTYVDNPVSPVYPA
jgi:hypothetical protein